jgi:hypothetical protein
VKLDDIPNQSDKNDSNAAVCASCTSCKNDRDVLLKVSAQRECTCFWPKVSSTDVMMAAAEAGGAIVRCNDDCILPRLTQHGLSDPVCRGAKVFHLHHPSISPNYRTCTRTGMSMNSAVFKFDEHIHHVRREFLVECSNMDGSAQGL